MLLENKPVGSTHRFHGLYVSKLPFDKHINSQISRLKSSVKKKPFLHRYLAVSFSLTHSRGSSATISKFVSYGGTGGAAHATTNIYQMFHKVNDSFFQFYLPMHSSGANSTGGSQDPSHKHVLGLLRRVPSVS